MVEVLAEYDPESRGGNPADGRKVKGATIHWVDAVSYTHLDVYKRQAPAPDPDR